MNEIIHLKSEIFLLNGINYVAYMDSFNGEDNFVLKLYPTDNSSKKEDYMDSRFILGVHKQNDNWKKQYLNEWKEELIIKLKREGRAF